MHITSIHEENIATQAPLCNTEKTGSHTRIPLRTTLWNHTFTSLDGRTTNNVHEKTDPNDQMVYPHNGRMVGNNEQNGVLVLEQQRQNLLTTKRKDRVACIHKLTYIIIKIAYSQTVDLQAFSYK